jgi:hypothetical protein
MLTAVRTPEGDGMVVRRPFPTPSLDHFDPFLLFDHMGPIELAPGQARGFPDHPHRGFETVTYILEGALEHRDSAGNHGVLGPGDVQWMTAGGGVVHSEMPTAGLRERGGRLHGFQLWVNLPRRDKMMHPRYQDVPAERIPVRERSGVRVKVIAGEALGGRAVIETRTPIFYLHFTLAPGARVAQPAPPDHHAMAYVFSGEAEVGTRTAREGDLVLFASDGDGVELSVGADAPAPADVLLIGGVPLREPVARYGPFVMNTREEIQQAVLDYQSGKLGRIR